MAAATYLTKEEVLSLRKTAFLEAKAEMVGLRTMVTDPSVASGAREWGDDEVEYPPVTDNMIMGNEDDYELIDTKQGRITGPIHKFGEGFKLAMRDVRTARANGRELSTEKSAMVARVVSEKFNKYILIGAPQVKEEGIITAATNAGNTKSITNKWTTTDGDPYYDMNDAIAWINQKMLYNKAKTPSFALFAPDVYHLILNDDLYGNVYWEKMLKNLPIPKENFMVCPETPSGQVMIGVKHAEVAELKMADPLRFSDPFYMPNDTVQFSMDMYSGRRIRDVNGFYILKDLLTA